MLIGGLAMYFMRSDGLAKLAAAAGGVMLLLNAILGFAGVGGLFYWLVFMCAFGSVGLVLLLNANGLTRLMGLLSGMIAVAIPVIVFLFGVSFRMIQVFEFMYYRDGYDLLHMLMCGFWGAGLLAAEDM